MTRDPALPAPRPMAPFMTLWTGQALSLLGSQSVQFAIIWWITVQTGSAAALAAATFVGLVPQVVLGPVIGTLVDRWNRKAVMMGADLIVAAASLVLSFAFFTGRAGLTAVFLVLLVRALGSTFHGPAMLASTSLMVPDRHLTRIQGINEALQGGLAILAAPAGAFLYGLLPMGGVMLVDVVTAAFALVPLFFIAVPQPPAAPADAGATGVWRETLEGVRFVRSRRGILALVVMATAINLFLVPAFSLLPLLVRESLAGDEMTLAWLTSTFGIGMIAGGVLLGVWGGFRRRIVTSLTGMIGMGLAVLVLGASPPRPAAWSFGAMLMVGLMAPVCNGPIRAIMQAIVPPHFQGRVFTLLGTLSTAMAPVGLLLAAPIAGVAGIRSWFLLGGALTVLMGGLAFLAPTILGIESAATPEDSGGAAAPDRPAAPA